MAITDFNGVYGMPRGYKIAKNFKNFKYICGTELTFLDHANLTLIAKNRKAYGAICRLITEAKTGEQKGASHLTLPQLLEFFTDDEFENLVALPRGTENLNLASLKDAFGSNLYLPLSFYLDGKDRTRVQTLKDLSKTYDIPLVASNDVEFHIKQRKIIQDVLISIRETKSLKEVGFKLSSNAEKYIKTPQQMQLLYKDFPQALAKTLDIADQCVFSPGELRYHYPSEWIPSPHTAQSYLEELVRTKAPERYKHGLDDRTTKQILHELKLIKELKYADYFLTIFDLVDYAHRRQILCQGRGSAANSVICYILGITAIDPIQMDLLFERFISVERNEPPDIDIDFEHERREEVIKYIYDKYGRHRAGMVSAVVTYRYRSAFREVCKAFGVPVGTLSAKKVLHQFEDLIKDHPQKETLKEKIEAVTNELQGFPRHLSIHSGGFTLSAEPITEIVPVEPARMDGRTIVQWDKYDLDTLGLLKVDVLSLGMLSCLSKVLKSLNLKLYEIPHDDPKTYKMIQNCETVGTFQIESRAQMSMLGRLKPENFYDLVIEVAIVRPGPIVGKMIHPYLKRRRGLEKITYPNEIVKRVLGRTLGVPLFQEQVMKLAIELAGFTPGEADQLRKCINAWRTSAPIAEMADRLKQGLMNGGMTEAFADQIFEQIQGFSHYGFPESHAASFALLAYASCYLKAHFPAEFACQLINSQPMGFYRTDTILYEAIRNGVKVKPVSVLHSQWDCTIEEPNTIRLGFRVVKGVSESDVELLVQERTNVKFTSLADFVKRSTIRSDVLARFALAGRFEEFNWSARESLWAILEYQNLMRENNSQQLSLFADTAYLEMTEASQIKNSNVENQFGTQNGFEKIQSDYGAFSLSLQGHPMQELRKTLPNIPKLNSKTLRETKIGSRVKVAGLVLIRQKPPTAKGTCFATLEDEFGFIDLVLFHDTFEATKDVFLNHCFIIIDGKLEKDGNSQAVIVSGVKPVWNTKTLHETPLALEPDQYFWM